MQSLVVQKFGGTSLGSIDLIRQVARFIQETSRNQKNIVVVSAMAGHTNRLVEMSHQVSSKVHPEAYDLLLASGEQVTCALLSMALHDLGVPSIPLLGFQIGLETDALFSRSRITRVNRENLDRFLDQGVTPVVAGFQGVESRGFITTLGRGGSDTSAVAIAVGMQASRCDIFTDIDGVYTAGPRVVPEARKIQRLTYQEMMELASLGAKVLHMRSVELAAKYSMPLWVGSTFLAIETKSQAMGTWISKEEKVLESPVVSAVTADRGQCLISLHMQGSKDGSRFPAKFFRPLADAGINVDIIIDSPSDARGDSTLNFTVPREDGEKARSLLASYDPKIELANAVKISVVGIGMRTHSGVAAKIFETLEALKIPVYLVTTSEITVSVIVDAEVMEPAVRSLHQAFSLDQA